MTGEGTTVGEAQRARVALRSTTLDASDLGFDRFVLAAVGIVTTVQLDRFASVG